MAIFKKEDFDFLERSRRSKPFKMTVAHFHNHHELYYLVSGKTKYFIGNEIFILSKGDMVFVPKGEFHKTDSGENSNMERVIFAFDDEFASEDFKCYVKEFTENKHIRFNKEQAYKIENIIHKIEKENSKKESGYEQMQKLYLRQLLILISRYRIKEESVPISELYTLIQDVAKYISENYNQDLSLGVLAKKYSISPNHLSKQFKNVTGVGLNEYINISRITAAEKLLAEGNIPITRVATECGFNDSCYFAAVFKKIRGITPKKYSMINR